MTNLGSVVTKWMPPASSACGEGAARGGEEARSGYLASTTMVFTDAVAPSAISTSTM